MAAAERYPTMSGNLAVGTFYKLPPSLYGGKIGAGAEVVGHTERKVKLEYRQRLGTTEGFLAAERDLLSRNVVPTPLPTLAPT